MSEILLKLEMYEGPLDLLLHLIKKNEVDINDIPMAIITAQYLEYLDFMQVFNIELVGEFLLMAATLIQIKSSLVLPALLDEKSGDLDDPRLMLVKPLLEYAKLKGIVDVLETHSLLNRDVFLRGYSEYELQEFLPETSEEAVEVSFFDLISAFKRIGLKGEEIKTFDFIVEKKTINEKIEELTAILIEKKEVEFETLVNANQEEKVLSFLAILELAKVGFLIIYQNIIDSDKIMLYLINAKAKIHASEELNY